MKRSEKSLLKKEAILRASLKCITTYGFHGTNMKMIAREANIAAGTIYIHFKNKEEVINILYNEISAEINELVHVNYKAELSYYQNFINIWKAMLTLYIENPEKPEFLTQYAYSPYITSAAANKSDKLLEPIVAMFEKARKEKVIKDIPTPALIGLTHSPITSLVRMAKYNKIKLSKINITNYAQACWDAIEIHDYKIRKGDENESIKN
ncbi:MAG: TetR/AcrR family transcriptional regulator [Bacteroidota bacterium]